MPAMHRTSRNTHGTSFRLHTCRVSAAQHIPDLASGTPEGLCTRRTVPLAFGSGPITSTPRKISVCATGMKSPEAAAEEAAQIDQIAALADSAAHEPRPGRERRRPKSGPAAAEASRLEAGPPSLSKVTLLLAVSGGVLQEIVGRAAWLLCDRMASPALQAPVGRSAPLYRQRPRVCCSLCARACPVHTEVRPVLFNCGPPGAFVWVLF